ncbi:hypothetical protein V6N12_013383 [Hibiscus sabdariffa]|uniref:Uncharacterized protein n=1 Tax=Hibiscus sabdariffa TaxID=183260 RepID=A0ABR2D6C8_9ROSI
MELAAFAKDAESYRELVRNKGLKAVKAVELGSESGSPLLLLSKVSLLLFVHVFRHLIRQADPCFFSCTSKGRPHCLSPELSAQCIKGAKDGVHDDGFCLIGERARHNKGYIYREREREICRKAGLDLVCPLAFQVVSSG